MSATNRGKTRACALLLVIATDPTPITTAKDGALTKQAAERSQTNMLRATSSTAEGMHGAQYADYAKMAATTATATTHGSEAIDKNGGLLAQCAAVSQQQIQQISTNELFIFLKKR